MRLLKNKKFNLDLMKYLKQKKLTPGVLFFINTITPVIQTRFRSLIKTEEKLRSKSHCRLSIILFFYLFYIIVFIFLRYIVYGIERTAFNKTYGARRQRECQEFNCSIAMSSWPAPPTPNSLKKLKPIWENPFVHEAVRFRSLFTTYVASNHRLCITHTLTQGFLKPRGPVSDALLVTTIPPA